MDTKIVDLIVVFIILLSFIELVSYYLRWSNVETLGLISLMLIIVIVAIIYVMKKRVNSLPEGKTAKQLKDITDNANKLKIDMSKSHQNFTECSIKVNSEGKCEKGYNRVSNCCYSGDDEDSPNFSKDMDYITYQLMAETSIKLLTSKVSREALSKTVDKVTPKLLSDAMTKIFTKIQEKIADEIGEKIVQQISEKTSVFMSAIDVPGVGWAMDIFQVFGLFLTATDFQGWNLSVDYETIEAIRNEILVSYRETLFKNNLANDLTYPPMFNIFEDDSSYNLQISKRIPKNKDFLKKIQTDFYGTYFDNVVQYVKKTDRDLYNKLEEYITGGINNNDLSKSTTGKDLSDEEWNKFNTYSIEWSNSNDGCVLRDKFFYGQIEKQLRIENRSNELKYYMLYDGMSGKFPMRCAVSYSVEGANKINDSNRLKIYSDYSWMNPNENSKNAILNVLKVTDKILIPTGKTKKINDKGGDNEHTVKEVTEHKLKGKGCFAFPVAALWSYCESKKEGGAKLGKNAGNDMINIIGGRTSFGKLDPYKEGVRFNRNTFLCEYTESYCSDRLMIDWDADKKSCYKPKGQDFAEMILSPTIVRPVVKGAEATGKIFGAGCPTKDSERHITNNACCRFDKNCNNNWSCEFCRYGNTYTCVGSEGEGSTMGNYCGSSRRCLKEGEKAPSGNEQLWQAANCVAGGVKKVIDKTGAAFGGGGDQHPKLKSNTCCNWTLDKNDKNSCMYCPHGNTYSLVGSQPAGRVLKPEYGGKYCTPSRRCL